MQLVLKRKMTQDVNLNELSAGTVFRFFKNKTLEQSVNDSNIYIMGEKNRNGFLCTQLSEDCAIIKRHGPYAGYVVNCKIKTVVDTCKQNKVPLGGISVGSIVMLYLGNNEFSDEVYMIANNPLEKKLISLVNLETGQITEVSDDVQAVVIDARLIIKDK